MAANPWDEGDPLSQYLGSDAGGFSYEPPAEPAYPQSLQYEVNPNYDASYTFNMKGTGGNFATGSLPEEKTLGLKPWSDKSSSSSSSLSGSVRSSSEPRTSRQQQPGYFGGGVVQTNQRGPLFPTYAEAGPVPEVMGPSWTIASPEPYVPGVYTAPARSTTRVAELTQRFAEPAVKELREGLSDTIRAGGQKGVVGKEVASRALVGYGKALDGLLGSARRGAENQYEREYATEEGAAKATFAAGETAKQTEWQARAQRVQAVYNAVLQDWLRGRA